MVVGVKMATSGLHYVRETPPESVYSEIQTLNKLNDEVDMQNDLQSSAVVEIDHF